MSLLLYQIVLGWQAVRLNYFQEVNLWWFLLAIGCVALGIIQQVLAWVLINRIIGINLPWQKGIIGYVLSFVSRYIPGSVWGYLGRNEWLWQNHRVGYSMSNIVSILEVGFILLTGVWVIGYSLIFHSGLAARLFYLLITVLFLVTIGLLRSRVTVPALFQRLIDPKVFQLENFFQSRSWLLIPGLLVVNWFYYGLAVFLAGKALGAWTAKLSFEMWLSLSGGFGLAWLGAFLAFFLPAGLGLREFLLTNELTQRWGLILNQASALSVVIRFLFTLAELLVIMVALLWRAYSNRTKNNL